MMESMKKDNNPYQKIPIYILKDIAYYRHIELPKNKENVEDILYEYDLKNPKWSEKIIDGGLDYILYIADNINKYDWKNVDIYVKEFFLKSFYYLATFDINLKDKTFEKYLHIYISSSPNNPFNFIYKSKQDESILEILYIISIVEGYNYLKNFKQKPRDKYKIKNTNEHLFKDFQEVFLFFNSGKFKSQDKLKYNIIDLITERTIDKNNFIYRIPKSTDIINEINCVPRRSENLNILSFNEAPLNGELLTNDNNKAYELLIELNEYPAFGVPRKTRSINYIDPVANYYQSLFKNSERLNFFVELLVDQKLGKILTKEECFFVLTRGYLKTEIERQRIERYEYFRNFSPLEFKSIMLSQNLNLDDQISLYQKNPNVIEKYVSYYHNNKPDIRELSRQIGMIIPPDQNDEDYFLNNLWLYQNIFRRTDGIINKINQLMNNRQINELISKYSKYMTDYELFNAIQVYINYESRIDLINQINLLQNKTQNKKFFVPLIPNCQIEISNDSFIIGYGTLTNYYCIEIDDSLNLSHLDDKNYTIDEIYQLKKLLFSYLSNENVHKFYNKIQFYTTQSFQKFKPSQKIKVNKLLKLFLSFDSNSKYLIKQWFLRLFYIGMYLSGWKGPGFPYPNLNDEQKKHIDEPVKYIDEDLLNFHLNKEIITLNNIFSKLPNKIQKYLYNLPYPLIKESQYDFLFVNNIHSMIENLIEDLYYNSFTYYRYIQISNAYLDIFYDYLIPGYNYNFDSD